MSGLWYISKMSMASNLLESIKFLRHTCMYTHTIYVETCIKFLKHYIVYASRFSTALISQNYIRVYFMFICKSSHLYLNLIDLMGHNGCYRATYIVPFMSLKN